MEYRPITAQQEWRQHWKVVLGCGLGMAACYSSFSYVASLFVQPLEQAFGWTRGQQALSHNANLVAALLAPFIGALIDRRGVRRILLPSIVAIGIIYVLLANLAPAIWTFYAAMAGLGIIGIATTGLAYTRAVTSWFDRSRGLALAASRVGLALAGAALPVAVFAAIQRYGFSGGYLVMAATALLIGLPVSWAWVFDRQPEDLALPVSAPKADAGWRLWPRLLRNPRILLLCLASGLTYGPAVGLLSQMQPLLVSKGIEPAAAAGLLSLLALSVFAGTIVTGVLLDRVWAPLLGFLFTLGPVVGCAMLYFLPHPGTAIAAAAVILIGLAQGAEIDLIGYTVARYFGMGAFAAIYGLMVAAIGICSALGAIMIGQVYDRYGSYNAALAAAAVCFFIAAIAYPLMGKYPATPGEAK